MNMRNCPYCERERDLSIQPNYTTHTLRNGEKTWIAYCPVCGAKTPYTKGLKPKTIDQAKISWNAYDLAGKIVLDDVPMQTFSP